VLLAAVGLLLTLAGMLAAVNPFAKEI